MRRPPPPPLPRCFFFFKRLFLLGVQVKNKTTQTLVAVAAHINTVTVGIKLFTEIFIFISLPDLLQVIFGINITQLIITVLVKTAGYYRAIPVDQRRQPHTTTGFFGFIF